MRKRIMSASVWVIQGRVARVVQAPGQALRRAAPVLDLAQHQNARIRRQRTPVQTGLHGAARHR